MRTKGCHSGGVWIAPDGRQFGDYDTGQYCTQRVTRGYFSGQVANGGGRESAGAQRCLDMDMAAFDSTSDKFLCSHGSGVIGRDRTGGRSFSLSNCLPH